MSRVLWGVGLVCLLVAASGCGDSGKSQAEYLASGDRFVSEGKIDEAIVQYRNAVQADPRNGEAHRRLAETYEKAGSGSSALAAYVRAADLLPENVDVQVKAGTFLLFARRFEDAKTRAERALQLAPQHVDALILRANSMAGLNDMTGAIREIEQALASGLPQADGRVFVNLGALQAIEGKPAEAEAAFKNAIRLNPKSVEAHLALANFYWGLGRPADVEQSLRTAHDLDPSNMKTNRFLAAYYIATNRAPEAEGPLKVLAQAETVPEVKLALADYYVQMGKLDEARGVLRPLVDQSAVAHAATLRIAQIERTVGNRAEAQRLLEGVLAKAPKHVIALTMHASWALAGGDVKTALASARTAVATDATSAPARFALAQALLENKQPVDAMREVQETLRLNPNIPSAQLMLSRLELANGNTEAAVQAASEARRRDPKNPDVRLAYAKGLLLAGDARRAEPEIAALVAEYPDFAASHSAEGLLRASKGDTNGARAAFTRALNVDPDYPEALEGLLGLDSRAGRLPDAVARIERRLTDRPQNATLWFVAGRTYTEAGDALKAEKALRRVIELDASHMPAYLLLGRALARQQRLDDAVKEFDRVVARDASHIGAATMAAMIVHMQGRTADALKRYEAIVNKHPRAAVAGNNLAWMYAESGENLTTALQLAQMAKAQLPDLPQVSDTLGWVYYKQGLASLAIPPFEESVARDRTNSSYRYHLGLAYLKAGQEAKGRAALQEALRLNERFEGADDARRVLASIHR